VIAAGGGDREDLTLLAFLARSSHSEVDELQVDGEI